MLTVTHCPQIRWSTGWTITYNRAIGLTNWSSKGTQQALNGNMQPWAWCSKHSRNSYILLCKAKMQHLPHKARSRVGAHLSKLWSHAPKGRRWALFKGGCSFMRLQYSICGRSQEEAVQEDGWTQEGSEDGRFQCVSDSWTWMECRAWCGLEWGDHSGPTQRFTPQTCTGGWSLWFFHTSPVQFSQFHTCIVSNSKVTTLWLQQPICFCSKFSTCDSLPCLFLDFLCLQSPLY